jgi:hypothetical protein
MNLSIPLRINGLLEACNYPLFKTRTVYTVTTVPKEVPERLRFRSGKRNQKPAQKTVADNPIYLELAEVKGHKGPLRACLRTRGWRQHRAPNRPGSRKKWFGKP